jgi:TPR repeat protein
LREVLQLFTNYPLRYDYIRRLLQAAGEVLILVCVSLVVGCASNFQINKALEQEALGGNIEAQYDMGMTYYEARYSFWGKAAYWEDAARWFDLAARQGDAKAHYRMAQYFFNVRSDYNQSFRWLQLPAQKGIAEAQHLLGMHYGQAWGTQLNFVLAYKWMALAFEGNIPDPIGKLADLDWLVRRGKMNQDQITEGQRLAKQHTTLYGKSQPIVFFE